MEAGNIVTNGPYKLTEWNHDQNFVVEINENYFGTKPTLTKATFRIYDDKETRTPHSKTTSSTMPSRADRTWSAFWRILRWPPSSITFPLSNCYFLVADTTIAPTDSIPFRQALYKALDRETLTRDVFKDEYVPAYTVLAPDIPATTRMRRFRSRRSTNSRSSWPTMASIPVRSSSSCSSRMSRRTASWARSRNRNGRTDSASR